MNLLIHFESHSICCFDSALPLENVFTAWLYPGMGLKISCQMAPLVCLSPILPGLQHLSPSTPLTHKTSQNWVYWLSQTLLLCLVKNLLPFVVYF